MPGHGHARRYLKASAGRVPIHAGNGDARERPNGSTGRSAGDAGDEYVRRPAQRSRYAEPCRAWPGWRCPEWSRPARRFPPGTHRPPRRRWIIMPIVSSRRPIWPRRGGDMMFEQGGQPFYQVMFNLAEYQARQGRDGYRWDGEAWFGGDINRLWLKSEGEGAFREGVESAEVQALYSRAVGPYFNLQAGVRHDFQPSPNRTYATVGFEGLSPYMFEVEGALFLSTKGDLARSPRGVLRPAHHAAADPSAAGRVESIGAGRARKPAWRGADRRRAGACGSATTSGGSSRPISASPMSHRPDAPPISHAPRAKIRAPPASWPACGCGSDDERRGGAEPVGETRRWIIGREK